MAKILNPKLNFWNLTTKVLHYLRKQPDFNMQNVVLYFFYLSLFLGFFALESKF